jgi:hypothetical protein
VPALWLAAAAVQAQPGSDRAPPGDGPWEFMTCEQGGALLVVEPVT